MGATHMLTKETSKLYAAIAKGEEAQALTNAALSSQTRQARMDITDALHSAKQDFGKRLGALHSTVMKANKEEMKAAVSKAVAIGEKRMAKAEAKLKHLNAKTSRYAKAAASQIEGLRLSSKSARAEMKKEMLYAIRSAAALAKQNLDAAAAHTKKKFGAAAKLQASRAASSAAGRAKLAARIAADKKFAARSLKDAVTGMP